MLSFEITAIDIVLVIAVIVLLILYVVKLANSPEEIIKKSLENTAKDQRAKTKRHHDLQVNVGSNECPRGFGKIRGIGDDGSISDRCFSCYRMSQCYVSEKEIEV